MGAPIKKVLAVAVLAAGIFIGGASAAPPPTIAYQGYLTASGGTPINGAIGMTFALYTAPTGAAGPVWSETQAAVQVTNGVYSVVLGSVVPLALPFDQQYWLGVKIGTDAEMSPRQALASVPYAFRATQADSLPGLVIDAAGRVGIGTTGALLHRLEVVGDARVAGTLRTTGSNGWLNETFGGGWTMTDTTWIRAVNNKGILTAGNIQGATISGSQLCLVNDPLVPCRTTWPVGATGAAGSACTSTGSSVQCTGDALTTSQINYSSPRTGVFNLHSTAFFPNDSTVAYSGNIVTSGYRYLSSGFNGAQELAASLSLPHGTSVTEFRCWVVDNSSADIALLGIVDGISNSWRCGPVSSSGASAARQELGSTCSFVVDNATNSYYFRFRVSNVATCGSNCLLYGCKVTYAYTTDGR